MRIPAPGATIGVRTGSAFRIVAAATIDQGGTMSAVVTKVGSGKHIYEVREDWAREPAGIDVLAASVTVDAKDNVYCFSRNKDHPVVVFDRDGNFLKSWGAGLFKFPHTIRAARDGNLWIVDRDHAQMMLFSTEGKLLRTIGEKGFRSD